MWCKDRSGLDSSIFSLPPKKMVSSSDLSSVYEEYLTLLQYLRIMCFFLTNKNDKIDLRPCSVLWSSEKGTVEVRVLGFEEGRGVEWGVDRSCGSPYFVSYRLLGDGLYRSLLRLRYNAKTLKNPPRIHTHLETLFILFDLFDEGS